MKRMAQVVDTKNAMMLACIAFRINDNTYVPTNQTVYETDEYGNTVYTEQNQPVVKYNSNKSVMLDMLKKEMPYDITEADKNLYEQIETTLNYWTLDKLSGNISEFNNEILNVASGKEVQTSRIGVIAAIPSTVIKDTERRDIEEKLLQVGKSFTAKPGDTINTIMEITKVIYSTKFGAEILNGITEDGEVIWFFTSKKAKEYFGNVGDKVRITGKVKRITTNKNSGLNEGQLNYVKSVEKIELFN
tara:strand:- start:76 stop:813 length:738 start_codon:yes stop_codon:yes gene_type:complete